MLPSDTDSWPSDDNVNESDGTWTPPSSDTKDDDDDEPPRKRVRTL